jgi:PilZ domain
MSLSERRSSIRHLLEISVLFQAAQATYPVATKTVDISRTGLFLVSPRKLGLGTAGRLTLRVPTEISGSAFNELHCQGRVVHERSRTGRNDWLRD